MFLIRLDVECPILITATFMELEFLEDSVLCAIKPALNEAGRLTDVCLVSAVLSPSYYAKKIFQAGFESGVSGTKMLNKASG